MEGCPIGEVILWGNEIKRPPKLIEGRWNRPTGAKDSKAAISDSVYFGCESNMTCSMQYGD